jgi:hypothetical protein
MDRIKDMLNRQIMQGLFGTQSEPETGTYTNPQGGVYEEVMKALNKVRSVPEPKITYCSWYYFVELLMASNFTITAGMKISNFTWKFMLEDCAEFIVSDSIPVDDVALQFKHEDYYKPFYIRYAQDARVKLRED